MWREGHFRQTGNQCWETWSFQIWFPGKDRKRTHFEKKNPTLEIGGLWLKSLYFGKKKHSLLFLALFVGSFRIWRPPFFLVACRCVLFFLFLWIWISPLFDFLLAYWDINLLSKVGTILDETPHVHFPIECKALVFSPSKGKKLSKSQTSILFVFSKPKKKTYSWTSELHCGGSRGIALFWIFQSLYSWTSEWSKICCRFG